MTRSELNFPWRLYLAATLVGAFAGLIGGAFHALLNLGTAARIGIHQHLDTVSVPGWLPLMAFSALALVLALWLVRRFAPESAGSGVQEVEDILATGRPLRWKRVLPVKFVAGTLAVGSGLVLGREGPTIHMGAALGQLARERVRLKTEDTGPLIAAGAAAGLATAFNAPLASIIFVTEELRDHFQYRFATIQSVVLACCASVIVSGWMLGQGPDMPMPDLTQAPLEALPLFLLLGILIGALGVLFNRLLMGSVSAFRALEAPYAYVATAFAGILLGGLIWFAPATVGGGEHLLESLLHGHPGLLFLLALVAVRLLTTIGSYGLGLPGGIFAPMLALGTICGAAFSGFVGLVSPALALQPEVFAVAAMGALFAATVRAPLTGIILVIELTGAHTLALPIILTCLSATFTAEGLGGRPIYSSLLGLRTQPPPRNPIRRIGFAALLLAGFIALEQIDVAWQGTGMEPVVAVADRGSPQRAQAPTATTPTDRSIVHLDPAPPPPTIVAREAISGSQTSPTPELPESTPRLTMSAKIAKAGAAYLEPEAPAEAQATPPVGKAPERGDEQPRYSIQLISFRQPASLARFAQEQDLIGRAKTLAPTTGDARWRPVLIGGYPSRDAAEIALRRLPADLRALEPIIRRLPPDTRLEPIEGPTSR